MLKKIHKNSNLILESSKKIGEATWERLDATVTKVTTETDTYIKPLRKSVLARFPIVFSLLTTFGVATTFLGFEKIVSNVAFLDRHPVLMLILGISILAATGTLYKKLS